MAEHPTQDELSAFLLGKLPPENCETLSSHLEDCPPCQETVNYLETHSDTLLEKLRRSPEPGPIDPACEQAMQKAATFVGGQADSNSATQDFARANPQNADSNLPPVPPADACSPSVSIAAGTKVPSKEDFLRLLKTANVLSEEALAAIDGNFQAATDSADLAKRLVRQKILTKFQAQLIYQGKTRHLAFGEYVVLDRIGEGGMGQVFKARHRRMDRLVAIKVMNNAAMKEPEAVKRFQREVKAAAKLNHPHIVTAYDAGENAGVHFLVMEFVEGHDLSGQVKDHGPLPVAEAIDATLQTARGLAFAHAEGIVHRDIKPANLLRDKKGVVRILDMGLARFEDPLGKGKDEGLTNSGQVMGTIDYMAPEQAFNTRDAGPAADVYSLGCTLFRLLTGQPLFSGETVVQKLFAHRENAVPSLVASCANIPAALETLFQRMVAKNIADRPTMAEIVASLESLAKEDTVGRTSSSVPGQLAIRTDEGVHPTAHSKSSGAGRKLPPLKWIAAAAAGFIALLLAGIVLFLPTKDGTLRIEINDPSIEVAVKGTTIVLKGVDKTGEVTLVPGDKTLVVARGDFSFETDKLVLKKGETTTVHVELLPGKIQVSQDRIPLSTRDLAPSKSTLANKPQPIIPPIPAPAPPVAPPVTKTVPPPAVPTTPKVTSPKNQPEQVDDLAKKLEQIHGPFLPLDSPLVSRLRPGMIVTEHRRTNGNRTVTPEDPPPQAVSLSDLEPALGSPRVVMGLGNWIYSAKNNALGLGYLKIDQAGEYQFISYNFYDRNALYINGKLICAYRDGEQKVHSVTLEPGYVPFISFGSVGARGSVQVTWQPPGNAEFTAVPVNRIFHDPQRISFSNTADPPKHILEFKLAPAPGNLRRGLLARIYQGQPTKAPTPFLLTIDSHLDFDRAAALQLISKDFSKGQPEFAAIGLIYVAEESLVMFESANCRCHVDEKLLLSKGIPSQMVTLSKGTHLIHLQRDDHGQPGPIFSVTDTTGKSLLFHSPEQVAAELAQKIPDDNGKLHSGQLQDRPLLQNVP